jgi:hypothetical protein
MLILKLFLLQSLQLHANPQAIPVLDFYIAQC